MLKTAIGVTALALASEYGMAAELEPYVPEPRVSPSQVLSCMACSTTMDAVGGIFAWGLFEKALLGIAEVACIAFGLADDPVSICPQIVPQFGDQLFPVFSRYLFTRDRVCTEWLQWCSAPVYEAIDLN